MDLPSRHVFKMYCLESFQYRALRVPEASTCNHWNGEPRRRHPSSTHPPPKIYMLNKDIFTWLMQNKNHPYIYPLVPPSLCLRKKSNPPSVPAAPLTDKKVGLGSPNDLDPKVRNMHLQQQLLHGLRPRKNVVPKWHVMYSMGIS